MDTSLNSSPKLKMMEETPEWKPGRQLETDKISGKLTECLEYRADSQREANGQDQSLSNELQPVVLLQKFNIKLLENHSYQTDDSRRPSVPSENPNMQADPAGSTFGEHKYVISQLLPEIKVEGGEEGTPLRGKSNQNVDLIPVILKRETDIESPCNITTNGTLGSEPAIKLEADLTFAIFNIDSKSDDQHNYDQSCNPRRNPVVMLERLDLDVLRSNFRVPESTSSSRHSVPCFQLKTKEHSDSDHVASHSQVLRNRRIRKSSEKIPPSSIKKRQKFVKTKALKPFSPTTNGKNLHHISSDVSQNENGSNSRDQLARDSTNCSLQNNQDGSTKTILSNIKADNEAERDYQKSVYGQRSILFADSHTHKRLTLDDDPPGQPPLESGSGIKTTRVKNKEGPYLCYHCSHALKSKQSLERHVMLVHTANRPFSCGECSKKFKSRCDLKSHARVHIADRPFSCDQCPSTFKSNDKLLRHVKTVHIGDKPFACNECSRKFSSNSILKTHIRCVHIADRPFACGQCSSKFKINGSLRRHVLQVHNDNDQLFSCDKCSKKFKSEITLKLHKRYVHTDERPYSCDRCFKKFKSRCKLQRHLKLSHNEHRPFPCDQCSGKFKEKCALKAHVMCVHVAGQPFSCDQCPKRFKHNSVLKRHVREIHSENLFRTFSCAHCSKQFKSKGEIKAHVKRIHIADRPFSCNQCSKKFQTNGDLTAHKWRIHVGDRPFPCDQCSKKFKTKTEVKLHVTCVHEGDRPYSCAQCLSKFKLKAALALHVMMVHIGNRPFPCDQCSRNFKSKAHARQHVMTVHNSERPFECDRCASKFKSKSNLQSHIIKLHGLD